MTREYRGGNETRVRNLQVRLSWKEYERLERAAFKADMTLSSYVRSLIPAKPERKPRKRAAR